MSHIKVNPIAPKDCEDIVEFYNSDFVKYEPISESFGGFNSEAFNYWICRLVQGGLSFEAIDMSNDDKRVGVFLCTKYRKGIENIIDQELKQLQHDKNFDVFVDILHDPLPFVQQQIFSRPNASYFEGVLLSVLNGYGGQGIAGKLLEAVEEKARNLGLGAIYVCASSNFTFKAVLKKGFGLEMTIPYEQYLKDGRMAVLPKAPHNAVRACVKYLE